MYSRCAPAQVGAYEVRLAEVGAFEVCSGDLFEVSLAEVGAFDVCSGDLFEVSPAEVGAFEVRFAEVGAPEVGAPEVGGYLGFVPDAPGPELRALEIRLTVQILERCSAR